MIFDSNILIYNSII